MAFYAWFARKQPSFLFCGAVSLLCFVLKGPVFVGATDVIWYAPFYAGGGYCSEAISFVLGLDKVPDVRVQIVHHGDSFNQDFMNGLPKDVSNSLYRMANTRLDPSSSVVICHSEPGAWYPPRWPTSRCPPQNSMYTIGRTMFETDRIPDGWAERINKMDEVWVPAEFHKSTFESGGVTPSKIRVVGEPVDVNFFNPSTVAEPYPLPFEAPQTAGRTSFLSIFKWEARKAWDVLLEAYLREFSRDEDVTLYLLTNPFHGTSDFDGEIEKFMGEKLRKSRSSLPKVQILQPGLPQKSMPALYAAASCFVLPSRGEGWGRPHAEAMSMALPVIATDWSGTTEFMSKENSLPLNIDGLVEVREGSFKGHLWADPSITHLRQLMRFVHINRHRAEALGKKARADMVRLYSPEALASTVSSYLDGIVAKLEESQDL